MAKEGATAVWGSAIHSHNINISWIYRLRDLISQTKFITWFFKWHLSLLLWCFAERSSRKAICYSPPGKDSWTTCSIHKLSCKYPWLIYVAHALNRLWLHLKSKCHKANYWTLHSPFTYSARWAWRLSLTDMMEEEEKSKAFNHREARRTDGVGWTCAKSHHAVDYRTTYMRLGEPEMTCHQSAIVLLFQLGVNPLRSRPNPIAMILPCHS